MTLSDQSGYLLQTDGFLMDDGTPTALYDQLKDSTSTQTILATQIKALYADLYAINTEIHKAPEADVKGAISRVTGKDAEGVARIYNTFKALCNIATFDVVPTPVVVEEKEEASQIPATTVPVTIPRANEFHYNIQIHLPATNDISVYIRATYLLTVLHLIINSRSRETIHRFMLDSSRVIIRVKLLLVSHCTHKI